MGLGSRIRDPGSGIRDPEKTYSGSRIQGSKRHRIPDPDPQHCSSVRQSPYDYKIGTGIVLLLILFSLVLHVNDWKTRSNLAVV
jgi:hypothetical protein